MNNKPSLRPRYWMPVLISVLFSALSVLSTVHASEIKVIATIKPLHSLISSIMEGAGEPHLLMRGTASPHTYSLRPSDAAKLQNADAIFQIDETLESSLQKSIEALGANAVIVNMLDTQGLKLHRYREGGFFEAEFHQDDEHGGEDHHEQDEHHDEHDDEHEHDDGHGDNRHAENDHDHDEDEDEDAHGHGEYDAHVWLNPDNAVIKARAIANTLAQLDPVNAETYQANLRSFVVRLEQLDQQISEKLEPVQGVPFLVFHDGYQYFEKRYGLTAVGSVVVVPDRPPGVKRIRELRDKIDELAAVCIFAEPQFDQRVIDVIIEHANTKIGTLDPLGANIEDGKNLYFALISNMADSFRECLSTPG